MVRSSGAAAVWECSVVIAWSLETLAIGRASGRNWLSSTVPRDRRHLVSAGLGLLSAGVMIVRIAGCGRNSNGHSEVMGCDIIRTAIIGGLVAVALVHWHRVGRWRDGTTVPSVPEIDGSVRSRRSCFAERRDHHSSEPRIEPLKFQECTAQWKAYSHGRRKSTPSTTSAPLSSSLCSRASSRVVPRAMRSGCDGRAISAFPSSARSS